MSVLEQVESLLTKLSRGEKAQVLQWVVRDLGGDAFPGIDRNPEVAGGEACIVRTRIPVWSLVQARQQGASDAEILQMYPSLKAEDLANAWAYYRVYPSEIDGLIMENEAA